MFSGFDRADAPKGVLEALSWASVTDGTIAPVPLCPLQAPKWVSEVIEKHGEYHRPESSRVELCDSVQSLYWVALKTTGFTALKFMRD